QSELVGQRRGGLRSLFQHETGHRVAGPVVAGEFHNTSMTYFVRARRKGVRRSGSGRLRIVLYRALELTLAPTLRAVYRPEVTGLEHVPHDGPLIFAANHISFADEFFTPLAARRQVFYFAKAEYFTTPGVKGKAMAAFFRGMGQVPVERSDTRAAASVI